VSSNNKGTTVLLEGMEENEVTAKGMVVDTDELPDEETTNEPRIYPAHSAVQPMFACLTCQVIQLNASNFDTVVYNPRRHVLVEFYADWCSFCKMVVNEYLTLAKSFAPFKDVVIASVNADYHSTLIDRFGITGYPTFKLFRKGADSKQNPEEFAFCLLADDTRYNAEFKADAMVKWLNRRTGLRANLFVEAEGKEKESSPKAEPPAAAEGVAPLPQVEKRVQELEAQLEKLVEESTRREEL
jgi:thiol-disulfide isomerase/thioredoxin